MEDSVPPAAPSIEDRLAALELHNRELQLTCNNVPGLMERLTKYEDYYRTVKLRFEAKFEDFEARVTALENYIDGLEDQTLFVKNDELDIVEGDVDLLRDDYDDLHNRVVELTESLEAAGYLEIVENAVADDTDTPPEDEENQEESEYAA